MEAMFPGSSQVERKFSMKMIEFEPETPVIVGVEGPQVEGHLVEHPSGAPSLALRIECDGKVIAYSGDTEWVDALLRVGRDADLLIAESYWYQRKVRYHLDFMTLKARLPQIGAKRLVITHMSTEMLGRLSEVDCGEAAFDGMEIQIE
jgi:ribonuclease BN (tRNA processing enzyme)